MNKDNVCDKIVAH